MAAHGWGGLKTARVAAPAPAAKGGVHRRIKAAFDPAGLMNPGVILAEVDKYNLPIA